MKRRVLVALGVIVPLALFFVARLAAGKRPVIIGQHRSATGLQFSPDGARMLSYGNAEVSSWDLRNQRREAIWKSGLGYVFSPDGQSLAAVGTRTEAIDAAHARTVISGVVCDVATGRARVKFSDVWAHPPSYQDNTRKPVWSADGRAIWLLSDFHLRRFDTRSGALLSRVALFSLRDFDPFRMSLLLSDRSFVVSSNRKGVELRNVKTGEIARSWKIKSPFAGVTPMVQSGSPDARFLAVGFDGRGAGKTQIYRISGEKLWETPLDSAPFMGFSHDSRLAVFTDESHFIARNINNGREVWHRELPLAQSFVLAPDNRHLYNVDAQGVIRRWNVSGAPA